MNVKVVPRGPNKGWAVVIETSDKIYWRGFHYGRDATKVADDLRTRSLHNILSTYDSKYFNEVSKK